MDISEVKFNLGEVVLYSDTNMKNIEYRLTACILRKNKKNEFKYSAELQDIKNNNSIIICDLSRIEIIQRGNARCRRN